MTLTERQKQILQIAVEEYIRRASPVSSQLLEDQGRLRVSPATIRNEMKQLEEKGFLEQPHTSAGRIPTDQGYRFFVNTLFEKNGNSEQEIFDLPFQNEDEIQMIHGLVRALAGQSSNLAFVYLEDEKLGWKEGWEELLKEPEFEARESLLRLAAFLEDFEEAIGDFEVAERIKIFIGKENPFSSIRDFSIIVSGCDFGEFKQGLLGIIGPKRMAYRKNIRLIRSVLRLAEKR